MDTAGSGQGRHSEGAWHPRGWSLRTKISVVLLLPVVVALALAGTRVRAELAEASKLSAVRDQLPALQSTLDLAGLVEEEMVLAASSPGSAELSRQIAAVDSKTASVQQAAQFAKLPSATSRTLDTVLGRLAGLRMAGVATGSATVAMTAGYHDIAVDLSRILPEAIAAAGSSQMDTTAATAGSLMQLRTTRAVEEALIRSAGDSANDTVLAASARAAAEEGVLGSQVERGLPQGSLGRFRSITASNSDRQATLQDALTTGNTSRLTALLTPLATESAALSDVLAGLVLDLSATVTERTDESRADALRDTALVLGALLGALAIALLVARSLVTPVRRLHAAALTAANRELPETIEKVRAGEPVSWESIEPVPVDGDEEIGQLARAFGDMHRQAVRLAADQAELRRQVSEMFMTLARRNQSLVEQQLTLIEDLEADERDPQRLEELFRLDHMATRLRRNGENLQVLAGGSPARRDHGPVSTAELLRAATSEVKDYRRVAIANAPNGSLRSHAASDVMHILAELLENAIRFSPPEQKVVLTADRGADGGLLVEVVDSGLGMQPDDLAAANARLASGDTVSPETTRRMGLFVVGRLAAPLGVTVRLRPTHPGTKHSGITASVHVPGSLVLADGVAAPQPAMVPREPVPAQARPAPEPVRTPIFDGVVSGWFTEAPSPDFRSPVDETWRAAEIATEQPVAVPVTSAGLPTRRPGAQLAPGAALPRRPAAPEPADFRDPNAVRNNLARHYNGMRAARARTGNGNGQAAEGKAEPR
ncbi:HAMP domain-containing protein [Amycolatopsis endophytica]|uniref:histidine kinase n=1 Tax=Amycolatopsis endophytica TaxID=860233 RepID=A0A853B896_9PSEU|nr:ATP-binding protein [Amycolatopsis endophytica]NYI90911.1 signal transduction histidine kinase [Amycolatopsis endophytica]